MAITVAQIQTFSTAVASLQSFPLCCIYLIMIMLAPVWQRITSPVQIRPILIIYNFVCSTVSLYSFFGFIYGLQQSDSIFQKGNSEILQPFFRLYWMTKNFELLDTVFMILRHKQRQISFLHVYHHSSILLLSDTAYHHYSWPGIAPYLMNNSFVHVVLYAYYGLTALFPDRSFPWKKLLTQLQIIQFFIGLLHASYGYLYHGFCVYGILYGLTMTTLFMNFYYFSYLKPKKDKKSL